MCNERADFGKVYENFIIQEFSRIKEMWDNT